MQSAARRALQAASQLRCDKACEGLLGAICKSCESPVKGSDCPGISDCLVNYRAEVAEFCDGCEEAKRCPK